ncbi:MAG: glutathione S-transferase family protein [Sphingomonadales bacterium]|nr:glutathione S-transferase family protein [Sphingomonadales bacterium]
MELYGHPFSSYTWKALIPFYACDIPFEFRMLDQDHPENYAFVQKAHPAGKFPVLVDGDTVIVEATAIIEYLVASQEAARGLIPVDPRQAVNVRMLDRIFDNYVMGSMQRIVSAHIADGDNPDPDEIAAGETGLRRAYAWLEDWLSENALPPHISLVSCAAAPSLFYAGWVERIPEDRGRVAALRADLLAHSAVARCVEEARPYRGLFPSGAPDRD